MIELILCWWRVGVRDVISGWFRILFWRYLRMKRLRIGVLFFWGLFWMMRWRGLWGVMWVWVKRVMWMLWLGCWVWVRGIGDDWFVLLFFYFVYDLDGFFKIRCLCWFLVVLVFFCWIVRLVWLLDRWMDWGVVVFVLWYLFFFCFFFGL